MNLLTSALSYNGSGVTSRLAISRRLGISDPRGFGLWASGFSTFWLQPGAWSLEPALSLLRSLRAVFRTALHTPLNADCIQGAAHHVISHARKIFDTAAAD